MRGPKRLDRTELGRLVPRSLKRTQLIQPPRLGEATYRRYNPVKVQYIDRTPWLTFRFLYRKRGVLLHSILKCSDLSQVPFYRYPQSARDLAPIPKSFSSPEQPTRSLREGRELEKQRERGQTGERR